METKCKLLLSSVLDPIWTDVSLVCNKTDITIKHKQPVFEGKKSKYSSQNIEKLVQTSSSVIPYHNISGVIKDHDAKTIRIDSKSNFFSTLGYYYLQFDYDETFNITLDFLTEKSNQLKSFEISHRTIKN
jgi:hypothetical protein